jgi:hypothetical protein
VHSSAFTASADPDAAAVWNQLCAEGLHGMTMFARCLAEHLRGDVTVDDARDLLWTHNSPELCDLLVNSRGWTQLVTMACGRQRLPSLPSRLLSENAGPYSWAAVLNCCTRRLPRVSIMPGCVLRCGAGR